MDAYQSSGSSPQAESNQSLRSVDLRFENHFSIFLIRPCSETGQHWLDANVGDEDTLTFGNAVVCEPRYVESILRGAIAAGLGVA
jgi:hypothetical protein